MFTMEFDKLAKTILESAELDQEVCDFMFEPEWSDVFEKFKERLNAELAKVKPKDQRLSRVELDFSGNEDEDDEGHTVMAVEHNNFDSILVNLQPFVIALNGKKDEESFEDAIVNYYYDALGNHVIQHECAHVIDLKTRSKKNGGGSHDAVFEEIRRSLDAIEPHLDQP